MKAPVALALDAKDLETAKSWAQQAGPFLSTMKIYISFINEYLGVSVNYISNGPGREQIISI